MPHVLIIRGKPETIFNEDQFARVLLETLGDDPMNYFLNAMQEAKENPDPEACVGECDRVYEVQEHYEDVLKEIRDELMSWKILNLTKEELLKKRYDLCDMIQRELL